jgi:hypothetical protein
VRTLLSTVNPLVVAVLLTASALSAGNPPQSEPPTAAFAQACYGPTIPTATCDRQAVSNITAARALEGVGPFTLPAGYYRLSLDQKIVAISNEERTARGLPALVETARNNALAQAGAQARTDPVGPPGQAWGSIWAGLADPLAADYLYMYDDGPNSPNGGCPQAGAPGCWLHRDIILGAGWVGTGAGHAGASLAQLFVG